MKKCWEKNRLLNKNGLKFGPKSFGIGFLLPFADKKRHHTWLIPKLEDQMPKRLLTPKRASEKKANKKKVGDIGLVSFPYVFLMSYVFLMFSLYCLILSYHCIFCWIVFSHLSETCKYLEGLCMISRPTSECRVYRSLVRSRVTLHGL